MTSNVNTFVMISHVPQTLMDFKGKMKPIHFVVAGVILSVNAFGFSIISSVVYWLDFSGSAKTAESYAGVYVGLWRSCTGSDLGLVCVETQNADDWLAAVQALTTIAIILLGIGSILGCVFTIKDNNLKLAYAWTSVMYLAGILQLSAVIVFWATVDGETRHFAVGFHLVILSILLSCFAGIFVMLSQRLEKSYTKLQES